MTSSEKVLENIYSSNCFYDTFDFRAYVASVRLDGNDEFGKLRLKIGSILLEVLMKSTRTCSWPFHQQTFIIMSVGPVIIVHWCGGTVFLKLQVTLDFRRF